MLLQGQVAQSVPTARATGNPNALQLQLGDLAVSEVLPRYAALAWSGQLYSASISTAAAATAFIGAAGGTPFIGVWNKAGSGKNIVPIAASVANAVAASAAGTAYLALWYGPTAAITGTLTTPVNQLTGAAGGSVAQVSANTAMTSSTALTNVLPLSSYYWATAAGAANVTALNSDFAGSIVIPPGSVMALGLSSALTSATWIGSIIWAELPI